MNAPSLGLAVSPLTPAIGSLVTGVDLTRPISNAVISRLSLTTQRNATLDYLPDTRVMHRAAILGDRPV
jgi:alpha-ketoglutarate-dependent taurine dioxygenase